MNRTRPISLVESAETEAVVQELAELLSGEIAEILETLTPGKRTERIAAAARIHFDNIVSQAPKVFACKEGCSYCCAIEAFARPVEIFSVAHFVRSAVHHRMLGNVDAFAAKLRRVGNENPEERCRKRKLCPFLFDGACAIYAARPLMCRFFVSRDVERCIRFFQGSEDNVRYEEIRVVAVMVCAEGLSKSLGAKGILDGSYSLVSGVAKVLTVPGLEERWLGGEDVFTDVRIDQGG